MSDKTNESFGSLKERYEAAWTALNEAGAVYLERRRELIAAAQDLHRSDEGTKIDFHMLLSMTEKPSR